MANKASGRMVSREISRSKKLAGLSRDALVLFFFLVPHQDTHGKMNGDPYFIKGEVVPRIDWLTPKRIEALLREISERTSVKWFKKDGLWYIHSLNFDEHQPGLRKDRTGKDEMPDYEGPNRHKCNPEDSGSSTGVVREDSGSSPGVLRPEVEVEVEEEGEGKSGVDPGRAPPPSDDKKRKPEKTRYGEFGNVRLTEVEDLKLQARLGLGKAHELIEQLSRAKKSKGLAYKDDFATILSWFRRDKGVFSTVCSEYNPAPRGAGGWKHPAIRPDGDALKCPHCKGGWKRPEPGAEPKYDMTDEERKKADEARMRVKGDIDKVLRRRTAGVA